MAFRHTLRVRYAECDPQGIVFNGNYLHYFDIAVTELYREAIGGWSEIQAHGVDAVVAEATVRYLKPLRFDDEVDLVAAVEHTGDRSMMLAMAIERDGATCAEGTLRYVFIDADAGAKATIPAAVREALAPYASAPA
ncbi:thioesterase family protein [soil metagenome]